MKKNRFKVYRYYELGVENDYFVVYDNKQEIESSDCWDKRKLAEEYRDKCEENPDFFSRYDFEENEC